MPCGIPSAPRYQAGPAAEGKVKSERLGATNLAAGGSAGIDPDLFGLRAGPPGTDFCPHRGPAKLRVQLGGGYDPAAQQPDNCGKKIDPKESDQPLPTAHVVLACKIQCH